MVNIFGEKLGLEGRVVRGRYHYPEKVDLLVTATSINLFEYAMVHEGEIPILKANSALSMVQGFNGKNHLDINVEVLSSGLAVPTTRRFITQLINVNKALQGKGVLYDANGDLIEEERLDRYANIMNHDCQGWLNESFEPSKDKEAHLGLDIVTVIGLKNGKPVFNKEPLQECLSENGYAELGSVNEQGFLTRRSSIQKYKPGETVYFSCPRQGGAARFLAGLDNAYFYCGRDPLYSDSGLGVFASAEGASAEK